MSDAAPMRTAVLTISTSRARERGGDDPGGDELERWAREIGAEVVERELVPDARGLIEDRIRHFADAVGCDLVLTTGGTGFAPDDVTPEATLGVAERLAPGLAEAMRIASSEHTDRWMLSRNVAAVRGSTLIINFPGSPRAIDEAGAAIATALPHAVALLRGGRPAH